MNKKISLGLCISLVVIAVAATFAITMVFSKQIYNGIISNISQRAQSYEGAEEINKIISNYYYGDLDEYNNNLGASLAEGYVNGLNDSSSYYMSASEYADYIDKTENGLSGVGIEASFDYSSNKLIVSYVYAGSPAANESLKAGDIITSVDSEAVTRSNYSTLSKKLYGSKLQTVAVEYQRDDNKITVQLMTGFSIPSIISKTGGSNGYIRISRFYKNTPSELETVLKDMENNGVDSVVFDVRNTSEGTIKYAAQTIDVIVPNITGNIASARDRDGKDKQTFPAQSSSYSMNFAVLINGGTSGAAELFACDLRDISYAQLVGTTTAGVGTMQEIFTLDDGSAILLTTALVVPKNGDNAIYNKVGVTPTMEVTPLFTSSDVLLLTETQDNQLQAALNLLSSSNSANQ